jgi:hypothetical protein
MIMKTPRFLFTVVGFGALTLGLGLAGEPSSSPSAPSRQGLAEDQAASKPHAGLAQRDGERDGRDQPHGKPSKSKADGHASEQSNHTGPASKAMPRNRPDHNYPIPVGTSHRDARNQQVEHTHALRTPAGDLQQPGLSKPATATRNGLMMNTQGKHREQPARVPVGSGSSAPLPGVVRGRGATAAGIGGLAPSSARSSAAVINGTGMARKP